MFINHINNICISNGQSKSHIRQNFKSQYGELEQVKYHSIVYINTLFKLMDSITSFATSTAQVMSKWNIVVYKMLIKKFHYSIKRNEYHDRIRLLYYKMKLSVCMYVFLYFCMYPNISRNSARTAFKQTPKIR